MSPNGGSVSVAARDSAPAADNLTAIVAELRSLLEGAKRSLRVAEDPDATDLPSGTVTQQDLLLRLEAAEAALERMAGAIQLTMSPAAAGLLERFTEPCTLIEAMLHASRVHEPLARERRISITLDCSPRLVLTPAGPMYTVLASALRNAVEAMECGGGEIEVIAELVTPSRGDPEVHIDVLDTGPGPDLEATERAFELGYTTKESGIGVGLALSREIVEELGGWVALRRRVARPGVRDARGAHMMIRYPASIGTNVS